MGDLQSRSNRSTFHSTLPISANLNDLHSRSILDNLIDKTSNAAAYYEPRSYPSNGLYEDSSEGLQGSEANERLEGSLRDDSYLRQEQPNFYRPYDFSANSGNLDGTPKSTNIENINPSVGNIQESSTNLYSSYHGAPKAAFPHGPFLGKPYGGFHGFGPYGHGYGHHHPYGGGSGEANSEENNGTNYRGYGSPNFGYHQPYSPFPYGGYGNRDSFYGPYQRNGNDSSGPNRHYGHGPYSHGPYGGPDFFHGPPGYGYNHDYGNNNGNNNGNSNNNNNNNRQTEEPTGDGDQNNSTKNGYLPPYGPPWVKPLLGNFHLHGFPSPFNILPYDHFHGVFKSGPVGVGHVGYPIYADPYLAGFPFHPYGLLFYGKKYLPPKGKPADSGDSGEATEAPARELANENPERITALNEEVVAPAPSSNQYKTSGQKRIKLVNFEIRRV